MRHSILIASANTNIYNSILSYICSADIGYTISGLAVTFEELIQLLEEAIPSIVILDSTTPCFSDFSQILLLKESYHTSIQFLILGIKDFQILQTALRCKAADYILLPIDKNELLQSLERISSFHEKIRANNTASRNFYLTDNSIDVLRTKPLSLNQLNITYGTHFVDGYFRMLFIKFDFPHSFSAMDKSNEDNIQKLGAFIKDYFKKDCADIILESKRDGIMMLLNYAKSSQGAVDIKISEMYERTRHALRPNTGFDLTICVSSPVLDACDVWNIKNQVRDAEWSRMRFGVNKIIFWSPLSPSVHTQIQERLQTISKGVTQAIENLSTFTFRNFINEFYSLPPSILVSGSSRNFTKQTVAQIFQIYWDTIASFKDPARYYDEITYSLHLCTTFEQHKNVLLKQCCDLIEQIKKQANQKYSSAIVQTISLIKDNIDKPILLEDAAEATNLSKGYLSFLFKKELGINFTKYVNQYKNSVACDLLTTSNLNISEIAQRTGSPDVRAFSKKFHSINGITPSSYRKLHKKEKHPAI